MPIWGHRRGGKFIAPPHHSGINYAQALSAVGTWLATLTATIMEAFRPTVRIAEMPASDRTAEVPARASFIVGRDDEE